MNNARPGMPYFEQTRIGNWLILAPITLSTGMLLLLFGGGGGYYGYSRWGNGGGIGIGKVVASIVVIVYLYGGIRI